MFFLINHENEICSAFREEIEIPIFAKYLIEVKEPVEMYPRMKNIAFDEKSKSIKYEIVNSEV